ncbi:phenylalanine--tRNA ligase subunit beta, partial [Phenylobacterium sp.]|uniref:phenylalanine--tRNA ligase subunit beta n=1 Tax=Phenylobacterium sp. TaxID=1871053 RepID=UPI00286B3EA0
GGESTACDEATTDVFVEAAWFDPGRTARTGRATGIQSDAQYRFARGVDPESLVPGIELATRLILELCGGEPSEIVVVGEALPRPEPVAFDRAYVTQLSGLELQPHRIDDILRDLGFHMEADLVFPPSWRRDVEGKADLVEEVARIEGYDALPAKALPDMAKSAGGVLTVRQARIRAGRRAMAAKGYAETITWSFCKRDTARLFGGGADALVVTNPIAADLDCMRPSILPNLIEAAGRNARRGFPDVALFEIGPFYKDDTPAGQVTSIAAVVAPHPPRRWDGVTTDALFDLKADLLSLLDDLGAPVNSLQTAQGGLSDWWHPGRSATMRLGKNTLVEFGELHPRILKALDVDGPLYGFELIVDAIPEPKRKSTKTKPALELSSLMPLSRDFAFVVADGVAAGDLVRAVAGADKALISNARVFDVYQGPGVADGSKSVAVEVSLQPREKTLTDSEIEALSSKVVAAAEKAVGAKLRA